MNLAYLNPGFALGQKLGEFLFPSSSLASDVTSDADSSDKIGDILVSSPSSASDVTFDADSLYETNRDWAEEQAQKQMDYQTSANKIAMDFSAEQADKERAFETEMANSAWQRAVADMKAAGLNPILAYSQGGAAVPSVNSASGVSSSGAKATMADTGYTASKLDLEYVKLVVNAATDIIGDLTDLVPLKSVKNVNIYKKR